MPKSVSLTNIRIYATCMAYATIMAYIRLIIRYIHSWHTDNSEPYKEGGCFGTQRVVQGFPTTVNTLHIGTPMHVGYRWCVRHCEQ